MLEGDAGEYADLLREEVLDERIYSAEEDMTELDDKPAAAYTHEQPRVVLRPLSYYTGIGRGTPESYRSSYAGAVSPIFRSQSLLLTDSLICRLFMPAGMRLGFARSGIPPSLRAPQSGAIQHGHVYFVFHVYFMGVAN